MMWQLSKTMLYICIGLITSVCVCDNDDYHCGKMKSNMEMYVEGMCNGFPHCCTMLGHSDDRRCRKHRPKEIETRKDAKESQRASQKISTSGEGKVSLLFLFASFIIFYFVFHLLCHERERTVYIEIASVCDDSYRCRMNFLTLLLLFLASIHLFHLFFSHFYI